MTKRIGYGTTLSLSTSAVALSASTTAVFTAIGQIRNIEGPQVETGEVEATTLDSTGNYKEFLLGLNDPGTLTFTLAWDSTLASHVIITNGLDNRNLFNIRIEPGGTTTIPIFALGRIKSFGGTFPIEDMIGANVGIRLTGPVRWPST
jgi:hypothetical protein